MSQQIPEGWYPDPQLVGTPGAERWWNGYQWTAHTRVTAPSYPAPSETPQTATPYGEQDGGWRPQPTPPARGSIDLPDGRRLADIGNRLGGYVLDLVIVFIVLAPLPLVLGDARDAFGGPLQLVVFVAYQVGFLRAWGATPGRMMARTRVEPEPGSEMERLDLTALVLRALVLAGPVYPAAFPGLGVIGWVLPIVAIVMAANDRWRQGMHDRFAHTVVVSR